MSAQPQLRFYNQARPQATGMGAEVLAGLLAEPKYILPKFFYDERGSELFTRITRQPEYYLTQVEMALLTRHAAEIAVQVGASCQLIEFGAGSSEKIRLLLERLRPSLYAPLDISADYLAQAASRLAQDFPWLEVHAVTVDFTEEFDLPFKREGRRVSFFPGSSIGNFSRAEAAGFLARIRRLVGAQGGLLIGVDLKKDAAALNAAYNDAQGVTAAFNLNALAHLNDQLGADFDLGRFSHQAFFNPQEGCVQMFLRSSCDQEVSLAGQSIFIAEGEMIHTENSHKYTLEEFLAMARQAGFAKAETWTDAEGRFAVFFLHNGARIAA